MFCPKLVFFFVWTNKHTMDVFKERPSDSVHHHSIFKWPLHLAPSIFSLPLCVAVWNSSKPFCLPAWLNVILTTLFLTHPWLKASYFLPRVRPQMCTLHTQPKHTFKHMGRHQTNTQLLLFTFVISVAQSRQAIWCYLSLPWRMYTPKVVSLHYLPAPLQVFLLECQQSGPLGRTKCQMHTAKWSSFIIASIFFYFISSCKDVI